jgi:hypothetical protein
MKPATINRDSQGWCKEARKGPVNAVLGGIAALRRKSKVFVVRKNCFVGDRRVIEGQCAVKIPVARNPVGMSVVCPDERHKQNRGFADRGYFHRAIAYRAADCSIELDHGYRPPWLIPYLQLALLVINNVADWGKSGSRLLRLSISQFDLTRT